VEVMDTKNPLASSSLQAKHLKRAAKGKEDKRLRQRIHLCRWNLQPLILFAL